MPIEFPCSNCHRQLRTPDGSFGKLCRCPACGLDSLIPHPSSVKQPTNGLVGTPPSSIGPSSAFHVESPASSAGDTGKAASNSGAISVPFASNAFDDRVTIRCPECRHELVCSSKLIGSKGQCKQCLHVFVIATDARGAKPSTGMVFSCPRCGQLFEGNEGMRGRKGKCHQCHEIFFIEPEAIAKPSALGAMPPRPGTSIPSPSGANVSACTTLPRVSGSDSLEKATPRVLASPDASQPNRPIASRQVVPVANSGPSAKEGSSTLRQPLSTSSPAGIRERGQVGEGVEERDQLPSGRSRTAYLLPGIFLVMVAVMALGLGGVMIASQVARGFEGVGIVVGLLWSLMLVALPTIALIGGIGLIVRRRRVVVVACLCSCFVPCSFVVLGIPFAIWGMIMAGSARASHDFHS